MQGVIILVLLMMLPTSLMFNTSEIQEEPAAIGSEINAEPENTDEAETQIDAIVLDAPNFNGATLSRDKSIKQVKLTQKSSKKNHATDEAQWFDDHQLKLPMIYSVEPYIPRWIPNAYDQRDIPEKFKSFKNIPLMTAFEYGDTQIYTYGELYYYVLNLQIVTNGSVTHALDFSKFAQFEHQYIAWAVVEDDVLYVQHTGNGYAKGFNNQNAYISAISLKDNTVLWTSKPLTANARNFIISGNSVLCGYGFTDEPDYLYVLDKKSGERIQTIKLKTGPDFIIEKDNLLYVRTYSEEYVFSMK